MVRAHKVLDWVELWLRVDGPESVLALDNMQRQPLSGPPAGPEPTSNSTYRTRRQNYASACCSVALRVRNLRLRNHCVRPLPMIYHGRLDRNDISARPLVGRVYFAPGCHPRSGKMIAKRG